MEWDRPVGRSWTRRVERDDRPSATIGQDHGTEPAMDHAHGSDHDLHPDRRRPSRGARALAGGVTLAAVLAACTNPPDPTVADSAPTAPAPAPAPADPAGMAPTTAAAATHAALLTAARAGDWDAMAALLPADGVFTASFGADADPIAYYRSLPRDPLPEIVVVLESPAGRVGDMTVWPDLHARDPFVITDTERPDLDRRFGRESVDAWIGAGAYLGWRVGITDDGTWRFMVAGD